MAERTGSLSGVTVVELCQNVAGPYAGFIMAQLGARVIKVERPEVGDDTRQWGPPFWGDDSVMFTVMNAGKESASIDLDDEEGRQRLRTIIQGADVLLVAHRPGSLERRGLSYEAFAAANPSLIQASISGFGAMGPMAQSPGYDPLVQAFSGLMSITGEPGGASVRVGTSIMDMGTGMWTVMAVLAALRERDMTGQGVHLTTSLLETGLAWIPYQLVGYLATGSEPEPLGSGLAMLVPYQAFPTADRQLVVAAGNDGLWQRLCRAIDRPDLADDPELATNPQRVELRDQLVKALSETFRKEDAGEWAQRLDEAGVPNSVVQTVGEVLAHPQTEALNMIRAIPHPSLEDFHLPGLPMSFDGWRPMPPGPPPARER